VSADAVTGIVWSWPVARREWWRRWRAPAEETVPPSAPTIVVGPPVSLAEALDIAERAVDLQPAANRLLRICADDGPKTGRLGREIGTLAAQFYTIWRRSESGAVPPEVRAVLVPLVRYHYQILNEALDLVIAAPSARLDAVRHTLANGLGDPALDLGLLRNRLRRAVAAGRLLP
jgi:hypothetical protein